MSYLNSYPVAKPESVAAGRNIQLSACAKGIFRQWVDRKARFADGLWSGMKDRKG
jgi:hypothetical protein